MHNKIEEIKKNESSPKVIKNYLVKMKLINF